MPSLTKNILNKPWLINCLGFVLVVLTPSFFDWLTQSNNHFSSYQTNTLIINSLAFIGAFTVLTKLRQTPNTQSFAYILPTITIAWFSAFSLLLFLREVSYARQLLLISYFLANVWAFIAYLFFSRLHQQRFAVVPFGRGQSLLVHLKPSQAFLMQSPKLSEPVDAIIADLHYVLPLPWQEFLAQSTLSGVPVYHIQQAIEAQTGKVRIDHFSENNFGSLQPSAFYRILKRIIDIAAIIILAPLFALIMLCTMLAIKIDSRGSVFYQQQRMGYRGRIFTMYKFRSMYSHINGGNFTAAGEDPRITRVGKVIRKYRLDELPQILNILKGEMSFIGPRPESLELSKIYSKEVPFFAYRHIVRPGISGWAQVNQGYAAERDAMIEKLQYDFFYIKHFSLWLDLIIVFKTLRTVLTGFGAR